MFSYHAPLTFDSYKSLVDRVGLYVQAYTLYSSVRPFGCSTIIGGVDKTGPALFVIEPSGVFYVRYTIIYGETTIDLCHAQGFHGAAVGKGRQLAKTELEKLKLAELSTREAVLEAARMYVHGCFGGRTRSSFALVYTSCTTTRRKRTSNSSCPGLVMRRTACTYPYRRICTMRRRGKRRRAWRTSTSSCANRVLYIWTCCRFKSELSCSTQKKHSMSQEKRKTTKRRVRCAHSYNLL